MKPVAVIIDDEVQIRRLLRVALEAENYQVHETGNGHDGLIEIANRKPDVILLDLGLPDMDGLDVLKRLREWSEAPVLVLSVRDDEQGKVAALDSGAEDYVTKPFSTPELLARLRAAQRKVSSIEACVRERSAGYSVHSSNAITMSAPSPICAAMALSGLKKCDEPSRCERKVTPSSVTLRNSFRLKTWKPPESVRIARGHAMKPCKPPNWRTISTPGRK